MRKLPHKPSRCSNSISKVISRAFLSNMDPLIPSTTAPVTIRMMSGELHTVMIDPSQSMQMLPQSFVTQMGYNPKIIERLTFVIDQTDGDETKLPDASWAATYESPHHYPLIHLVIQSEKDKELQKKFESLQKLVSKRKRRMAASEDEIMSAYSLWYLTYQPRDKSNRYTVLCDFIESHLEFFPIFTKEEITAAVERYEELTAEMKALTKASPEIGKQYILVNEVIDARRVNDISQAHVNQLIETNPVETLRMRETLREQFPLIYATCEEQTPFDRQAISRDYIEYFTRFELVEMGWVSAVFSVGQGMMKDNLVRIRRRVSGDPEYPFEHRAEISATEIWDLHRSFLTTYGLDSDTVLLQEKDRLDKLWYESLEKYFDLYKIRQKHFETYCYMVDF